jgi:plasmid stabilization system protein ParE
VTHRVIILPRAKRQLLNQATWWSENRSAEQAFRWRDGFERALNALAEYPERCRTARESDAFAFVIRELHFGLGRRPTHWAVFEVRGDEVIVYSVRHLGQSDLTPDDLQN